MDGEQAVWMAVRYGGILALSCALALYLTPIVRRGALRYNVLDRPDHRLKRHPQPVAYLGGVAVYLAFVVALSLVFQFETQLLGLLLGGTMLAMLGLFDDLKVLPPGVKLLGQLLAAWVLWRSNISIQLMFVPEWLTLPLTLMWLVGITNAVNIVDVSDGLAASTSAITALGLFVLATIHHELPMAIIALTLAGSLIGFLRSNQPPATIYLGDTGSLFVGFMLAALSMSGKYTTYNLAAAIAPIMLLIVPILDTTLVSIARLAKGQSPLRGSPDHFAIRLKQRGWSAHRVAVAACAASGLGSVMAIGAVCSSQRTAIGIGAVMLVVFAGMLIGLLAIKSKTESQAETKIED